MKLKRQSKKTAVIGAGLGGLAAAALLASRGYRVTVYERNSRPGGKLQEYRAGGFRFDTGPSLLTMPEVLKDLFRRCGESLKEYLTLVEPDPLCRYRYPDGTVFNNYRDPEKSADELAGFAPADRQHYFDFLNYSEKLYEKTRHSFLYNPLYQWSDLKNLNLSDLAGIDAFTSVSRRVDSYFESDKPRQFFKRFTTYNGSSPFRAPATLNVIPHVEITGGSYYVKGGMYRIVEALEKLARKMGATIVYSAGVKKIEVKSKRVTGLVLDNSQQIHCDLVVSNCDANQTLLKLIDPDQVPASKKQKQKRLEPSCSGFVLLLGTDRRWKQLSHHNIFFSFNYKEEFARIFEQKRLPSDPTIYVANSSLTDPSHAPENGSNLFILVNAPCLADGQDWKKAEREYPEVIVRKLEKCGLEQLSGSIRLKRLLTPLYFYEKYRSNRGSIYGASSNSRLAAFLRPRNKLRGIEGLYLAGGSTHPGGGIPLVILSAFHVATLVDRFER